MKQAHGRALWPPELLAAGAPVEVEGYHHMPEDALIAVGRLLKPHGIKGEIVFLPYMADLELLPDLINRHVVLQHRTASAQKRTITAWRQSSNKVLMRFENCQDPTQAETLREYEVFVPRCSLPSLPAGEYYWFEIEGLAVCADDGHYLGTISEIIYTGSNDVYVVRNDKREILVPALQDVIRTIDLRHSVVHLYAVPGLLD